MRSMDARKHLYETSLSDNSTKLNCHFEIIEPYRLVLASFPFNIILSRSSDKANFGVTGHKYIHV